MEDLTQPLINNNSEVSTPRISLEEETIVRNNERDSSFIEVKRAHRTASLPITKLDTSDGKRRHISLPLVDPRNSFSPRQSVVLDGDDRYILEESESHIRDWDKDDGQNSDTFVNVHVSCKLKR